MAVGLWANDAALFIVWGETGHYEWTMSEYKLTEDELKGLIEKVYEKGYHGWLDLKDSVIYDVLSSLEKNKTTVPLGSTLFSSSTSFVFSDGNNLTFNGDGVI